MLNVLFQEAWCIWTIVNMAYCCLILIGKFIQKLVFGELRVSEQQHIKDKFWNFVFYKFIFIFGVMNVQNMDEVVSWCAWFSVLGFLHLLSQLCKDRFEYLSSSPTRPSWTHAKVLMLLLSIQLMCSALFVMCVLIGIPAGINTFAFMMAECCLLGVKTLYVIVRYAIHLWDLHHEGVWENRAIFVYYAEFIFEMTSLSIDFSHHLHMLLWGNIFLSMASLVICMQLRYLFHEFQRRVRRHKNYLRVVNSMEARFPMATVEELEENSDNCAICWDRMESGRKLPCGHLFHNSCLRSWLEQDTSCPTCRQSLSEPGEQPTAPTPPPGVPAGDGPVPIPVPGVPQMLNTGGPVNTTNHFFHFDGSRYVSWLPSFSVEVTHTQLMANGPQPLAVQTSQLDNMARQVESVFPSMPLATIMEDLRVTRSVELTIENILEERLVAPPNHSARTISNPQDTAGTSEDNSGQAQLPTTSLSEVSSTDGTSEANPLEGAVGGENQPPGGVSLNFIVDENVPDLSSSEDSPDESEDVPSFRFSKSSTEREAMLSFRKESLLEQARRKYLSRHSEEVAEDESADPADSSMDAMDQEQAHSRMELSMPDSPAEPGTSVSSNRDELTHRRELAYLAAQRRMQQH